MIDRVEAVAKLMRIDHILDKNPLELSGGQVQRVAFGSTSTSWQLAHFGA